MYTRLLLMQVLTALCACTLVYGHISRPSARVHIDFSWQNHYAETVFNKPVYSNVYGQVYSVSMLRYYVGNISLHGDDGYTHTLRGYHLIIHDNDVDEAHVRHNFIDITDVPSGRYSSLSFTLGVDSSDNVRGPQEGSLDPLLGMYWTWSTGFIFFKMEGTAPSSPLTKHLIEYHLGGYQAPYSNVQPIHLPLRHPIVLTDDAQSLEITFDLGKFIDLHGGIDFSQTPSITDVKTAKPFMTRLQGAFHVR